jgi:hypothetical protein
LSRFQFFYQNFPKQSLINFKAVFSALYIRYLKYIIFLAVHFILYVIPIISYAAQIELAWDASVGPVTGYKIYYGTNSGIYDFSINVGNFTSCTISGLQESTIYYFAVTAYNDIAESDYSEEISHNTPISAQTSEPMIYASDISETYNLWVSTSPDRSNPSLLDYQRCSGDIYVFAGPDDDVRRVTFYLDGVVHQVENSPPYDFRGTAGRGRANFFDTTRLVDGNHEISAVIESVDGIIEQVTAAFTVDNEGEYDLWLSTSPDRSNPRLLDNQRCSGDIYVFAGPDDDVRRVTFYLDGVMHQVETLPPYDFRGTAGRGRANFFDTARLVDGNHEISAVIESVDGITKQVTAAFTVSN